MPPEDQSFPQLRLSRKAWQKTDVFAPDYVTRISPFAENDISSQSAILQVQDNALGAGKRRLNPNASRTKFVKKKVKCKFHSKLGSAAAGGVLKPPSPLGQLQNHLNGKNRPGFCLLLHDSCGGLGWVDG
uniref:Uncharacterized protein n=1 Tax=Molossus molossus TaxID=27622 RepID=A0A7J8HJ13_MOLMO|nr:hypothetical protein HJG59_011034 [Molossus molossus]